MPILSFVAPVFNEEKCLHELYARTKKTAESLGFEYELLCVDDGSRDSSPQIIRELHRQDPRVRMVSFSRNFGHQAAVMAGLHHTTGDLVAVVDSDMQDPPEVVAEMVAKWREGYKIIYGVRQNRKEGLFLRICYKTYYRILGTLANLKIPLDAGDFCLLDRQVVTELIKLDEYNPFVRGLRAWVGFSACGQPYDRPARLAGETKYTFAKLVRLGFAGIISYSNVLLNSATIFGLIISAASLLYALYIFVFTVMIYFGFMRRTPNFIVGWATVVCGLYFLFGTMFVYLGILGHYLSQIFMQTKRRPLFIVKEFLGPTKGGS